MDGLGDLKGGLLRLCVYVFRGNADTTLLFFYSPEPERVHQIVW